MTVAFEWEIPHAMAQIITIEPREGLIRGNEALPLSCIFAPRKAKKYQFRVVSSRRRAQASGRCQPPPRVSAWRVA